MGWYRRFYFVILGLEEALAPQARARMSARRSSPMADPQRRIRRRPSGLDIPACFRPENVADLRPDADHPRLEAADAITGAAVAADLLIEVTHEADQVAKSRNRATDAIEAREGECAARCRQCSRERSRERRRVG